MSSRAGSTYAANWDSEFDRIVWWDAVDYIGVDAFWPLTDSSVAVLTDDGCDARLRSIASALSGASRRFGKPVLVTEIGMKSAAFAAHRPWEWHEGNAVDLELQATSMARWLGCSRLAIPNRIGWLGLHLGSGTPTWIGEDPRTATSRRAASRPERLLAKWYGR